MLAPEATLQDEILRSNRDLRVRASALRHRSRSARVAARSLRTWMHHPPAPPAAPTSGPAPALGDVPVSDLFMILVDRHDFPVLEAVRALANGMAISGYPLDHERIAAADALDILHAALHPEE